MLTEVKAYSSWQSAPTLLLAEDGRSETDLIQIRNIEGLDPVAASVTSAPFGAVDGESYIGSSIPRRNIVLTIRANPDWSTWRYETLRRLIYSYFMPKLAAKLEFYSDDMDPVEISGIVESVETSLFSKDPEFVVSIICPDPHFTAIEATVLTGQSVRPGGAVVEIDYDGNVQTGVHVKVSQVSGAEPTSIAIQLGDPATTYFEVESTVDSGMYFEMSSVPMRKFIQNIDIGGGTITNLLNDVVEGSWWPSIVPGTNEFSVITDQGVQDWELTYFKRYGGL